MKMSRIIASWMQARIEADTAAAALFASIAEGGTADPDRISLVWTSEVEPVAPPLHLYDCSYELRSPAGSDLTEDQIDSAEVFAKAQFTDENKARLLTAIADGGEGTFHDWFIGHRGSDVSNTANIASEFTIRVAVVHG